MAALALLVGLTGTLVGRPAAGTAPATPAPTETPSLAGVLRVGVVGRVTTLDPLFSTREPERDLDALLFRGLTRLGPDGSVVPDLASGWQIGDGGRSYVFTLRPDARWQDGVPVTAKDVLFTIQTLQDPAYDGPYGAAWQAVTVDSPTPDTVRFRLGTPVPGFLTVATQAILPSHLLAELPVADLRDSGFGASPVGDSDFHLTQLDAAGAVLVRGAAGAGDGSGPTASGAPDSSAPAATMLPASASPLGSGASLAATSLSPSPLASTAVAAATPRPSHSPSPSPSPTTTPLPTAPPGQAVQRVEFRFYDDAQAMADAFRADDLDLVGGLPADLDEQLATLPGVSAVRYPQSTLTAAVLNDRIDHPIFRDARVRRALLMAVDRISIRDDLLAGAAQISDVPLNPVSPLYDPAAISDVSYDPNGAAKTLTAAGWKRGPSGWTAPGVKGTVGFTVVTVDFQTNPLTYAIAERLVQDWQALGLHVSLESLDVADLISKRLDPHAFDVAVIDVNVGLDPSLLPLFISNQAIKGGTNLSGFQSTQLDTLLHAAATAPDEATRRRRFADLERFLSAQQPILPLVFPDRVELVRDRLSNLHPRQIGSPWDPFWDVLTWRLAGTP